jgi:hypothetical protein
MTDPTPVAKSLFNYLTNLSPLLWLILVGLGGQLLMRFRSRMRRFIWTASHNKVALAASHPQLGAVTVAFNGVAVHHVHTTTVIITNDSNEDQTDVVITLAFESSGHIVHSEGQIEGDSLVIPLDPDYYNLLSNATTPAQLNQLNRYVVHKIPVFNRHQKAVFQMIVVRDDASSPVVIATCNHRGVKLDYVPDGASIDGVPLLTATKFGIVISVVLTFLLIWLNVHRMPHPSFYIVTLVAMSLGLFATRIGAAGVNLWRVIFRLVG